jgi:hypothetical protein
MCSEKCGNIADYIRYKLLMEIADALTAFYCGIGHSYALCDATHEYDSYQDRSVSSQEELFTRLLSLVQRMICTSEMTA